MFIDQTKGDKTNTTLENKQLVPLEVEAELKNQSLNDVYAKGQLSAIQYNKQAVESVKNAVHVKTWNTLN